MPVNTITPILNVSDVMASIRWFEKIGWRQGFTWKDEGSSIVSFGSVRTEATDSEAEIFLCLDGQGSRGEGGGWMSWWVNSPAEVDAIHARAVSQDLSVTHPPTDEPWGVREFHLRHPDGHIFRVSSGQEE